MLFLERSSCTWSGQLSCLDLWPANWGTIKHCLRAEVCQMEGLWPLQQTDECVSWCAECVSDSPAHPGGMVGGGVGVGGMVGARVGFTTVRNKKSRCKHEPWWGQCLDRFRVGLLDLLTTLTWFIDSFNLYLSDHNKSWRHQLGLQDAQSAPKYSQIQLFCKNTPLFTY